jgi:amino acid permease
MENELVAITAWETEYPRYSLPKAVRQFSGRIVIYHILAVFVLGLTVSANDPFFQTHTAASVQNSIGRFTANDAQTMVTIITFVSSTCLKIIIYFEK